MSFTIRVVAGLVVRENRLLLARRRAHKTQGGLWEFPGGKIEAGETPEQSLERELVEELGLRVSVGSFLTTSRFTYEHAEIELLAYWAEALSEAKAGKDHDAIAWVTAEELEGYALAPADVPFVAEIRKVLR